MVDPEGTKAAAEIGRESYWTVRSVRQWGRFAQGLDDEDTRSLARDFCDYLLITVGPQRTALNFSRYSRWLTLLVAVAGSASGISEQTLFETFDAASARKAEHLLRFLVQKAIPVPSRAAFKDETERRRIRTAIQRIDDAEQRAFLSRYASTLLNGHTVAKTTARLYVHAACKYVMAEQGVFSTQSIVRHIARNPGDAASLARFVTFLREEHFDLKMPSKKSPNKPAFKPDEQFARCIAWFQSSGIFEDSRAACAGILIGLTGIGLEPLCRLDRSAVRWDVGKTVLVLGEDSFELTEPVSGIFQRYLLERDNLVGNHSGPLFPGRPLTAAVSSDVVRQRLARHAISVKALGLEARRVIKAEAARRRLAKARQVAAADRY